jgi:hypothetical protein
VAPLLVLAPITAKPRDMFEAALSLNSPDPVETPALTVDFPEASPMPTPAPPADSPNVWISRKILKERNSHPMAQAQGKGQRRSLMQPQALTASHPRGTN